MPMLSASITSRSLGILMLCVVFLCFWGQFNKDVWTPDEPRVIAIAEEMADTGNVIIPHLDGQPFVEKPPLYFALAAGSIKLLPILTPITAVRVLTVILALLTLYFTYLTGRDLIDKKAGYAAVIILGTMLGFVSNSHWSRVDNLLILTLAAGAWSLYRGVTYRAGYLLLAGMWAGLGFLTKGPIAVIMLAGCWLGLVTARYISLRFAEDNQAENKPVNWNTKGVLTGHILALIIFVLISAGWVYLFWLKGTADTWHQWFWENNVGRFTGTAPSLGHLHPGQPFFYLEALAEYSLPWLPILVAWLVSLIKRWRKHQNIGFAELFIFFSLTINLLVLSLSDTKRSLYLFVLLPFVAIAILYGLYQLKKGWVNYYQRFWLGLCVILVLAAFTTPLYIHHFVTKIPHSVFSQLSHFNPMHGILVLMVVLALLWYKKQAANTLSFLALTTVMFFVSMLGLLTGPIDQYKSMAPEMVRFVDQIPPAQRAYVIGYGLNETSRSALYLYRHWSITNETLATVERTLEGKNGQIHSVIIDQQTLLAKLQNQMAKKALHINILAKAMPRRGKHSSAIYWVSASPVPKLVSLPEVN